MLEKEEKRLYREARQEYALVYFVALIIIVAGFALTELFSPSSMVPAGVLMAWAVGIARKGTMDNKYLLRIEPELKRLMSEGLLEHEAMKRLGCDKFYYKPFWAIV